MAGAWDKAENILCVRLDTIGDVLMTTPALRALRVSKAGRRLTLLTSQVGAGIARLVPEIDQVIAYNSPWMKATLLRQSSAPEFEMVRRLREGGFDAAVIFTVYSQNPLPSALLCYLADIPLRLAHSRENPYQLLTEWVKEMEPQQGIRHEVRRQLDLVATVGCRTWDERLSLQVPDEAWDRIRDIFKHHEIDCERPWIVIHPGASAPSRRYPPEGFSEVARQLALYRDFQVIFTGVAAERDLVAEIQEGMEVPSWSLAGALDLPALAALLSLTPVLISNNTGPAHMAAALGTPVVDLYALTNPQHTPWRVPHRVLYQDVPCKYCYRSVCPEGHHNCLRLVSPAAILQATDELLKETKARIRQ